MPAFRVHKVYMIPHRDLLVLAGTPETVLPKPAWSIDLPRELKGPGWVPILDIQQVPFADGTHKLCVVLDYAVVEGSPFLEFADLEGLALELKPG